MKDKIDIASHVREISEALGLKYENVSRLDITPREVQAKVYLENENGSKYIDDSGEPAFEYYVFEVLT